MYKKGSGIGNADTLSLLLCIVTEEDNEIKFFLSTKELPIIYQEISQATKFDTIYSRVFDFTLHGWPAI